MNNMNNDEYGDGGIDWFAVSFPEGDRLTQSSADKLKASSGTGTHVGYMDQQSLRIFNQAYDHGSAAVNITAEQELRAEVRIAVAVITHIFKIH